MDDFVMPLMLGLDVSSLTMSLVTVASPRGEESGLADSVESALGPLAHLRVDRAGDTVVARTDAGHAERALVVARLDTAPSTEEPLAYVEMGKLFGPGASDAKGALAVVLKAALVDSYPRDVTFVFAAGDEPACGYDQDVREAGFVLLARPTQASVSGDVAHVRAKQLIGFTDVPPASGGSPRGPSLGVPAVEFGPGDPSLAGEPHEFVPTAELTQCEFALRQWLAT